TRPRARKTLGTAQSFPLPRGCGHAPQSWPGSFCVAFLGGGLGARREKHFCHWGLVGLATPYTSLLQNQVEVAWARVPERIRGSPRVTLLTAIPSSGCGAPARTTSKTSTWTSRSAGSPFSPECPVRERVRWCSTRSPQNRSG